MANSKMYMLKFPQNSQLVERKHSWTYTSFIFGEVEITDTSALKHSLMLFTTIYSFLTYAQDVEMAL